MWKFWIFLQVWKTLWKMWKQPLKSRVFQFLNKVFNTFNSFLPLKRGFLLNFQQNFFCKWNQKNRFLLQFIDVFISDLELFLWSQETNWLHFSCWFLIVIFLSFPFFIIFIKLAQKFQTTGFDKKFGDWLFILSERDGESFPGTAYWMQSAECKMQNFGPATQIIIWNRRKHRRARGLLSP